MNNERNEARSRWISPENDSSSYQSLVQDVGYFKGLFESHINELNKINNQIEKLSEKYEKINERTMKLEKGEADKKDNNRDNRLFKYSIIAAIIGGISGNISDLIKLIISIIKNFSVN